MSSAVTVLKGAFKQGNDADFDTREFYEFFTPLSSMVSESMNEAYIPFSNLQAEDFTNHVTVRTGLIGRPKSIKAHNTRGQQEMSTTFEYSDQVVNADGIGNQGHFTEGVLQNELLDYFSFRTNRTTKEYVPAVMTAVHSDRNGVKTDNFDELYDFYTGQVLSTGFTNSQGQKYHSVIVPAYTLPAYTGMGAKGDAPTNQHMLVQAAAAYTVMELPGTPGYSVLNPLNPKTSSVMAASVKTWKSDWSNYRVATTNGRYQDDATQQKSVWREQAAYVWQSSLLKPDGSFASFVNYNWSGTSDSHWVKTSEARRFDHFSHGLESQDANGLFSAIKTGHNGTQTLASAANARYTELAYSGAEDEPVEQNNLKHFGGEVVSTGTKADGLQGTPVPHTGLFSIKLAAEQNMRYLALIGSELLAGKPYRLSVWVNGGDLSANAGRLYASVNGTVLGETSIIAATTKKAGNWYRLDMNVIIPASYAGQVVDFGCRNTMLAPNATVVYFDDFRVCPVAATMNSQVYDPRTNRLTYALDNENLFTRYQYNPDGRLYRVYRETFEQPGNIAPAVKLVKEYAYNYARNNSFTISATASSASVLPASSASVITGEAANFDTKSYDCTYWPGRFEVDGDGAMRTGSYILPDQTRISFTRMGGNEGHLSVTNVHGSHSITVSYTPVTHDPDGTILDGHCEMDWRPCPTGQYIEIVADGCGGSYERPRQANDGECPATPDCRYNIANPGYNIANPTKQVDDKPLVKPLKKHKQVLRTKSTN